MQKCQITLSLPCRLQFVYACRGCGREDGHHNHHTDGCLKALHVRLAESASVQVMYHPTAGHGGFLLSSSWRRQVLTNVKVVVATGADLAAKSAKAQ